jgi:hypothetical protein
MITMDGEPGLFVSEILAYPIKSLPAISATDNRFLIGPDSEILGDRCYWFETTDPNGKTVVLNGKYAARNDFDVFFRIHADFPERNFKVTFSGRNLFTSRKHDGRQITIDRPCCLQPGNESKRRIKIPHFEEIFGRDVFLCTDHRAYKPDDPDAKGITIMSMPTVRAIGKQWDMTDEEVIARFRPNAIINGRGMQPFEEFSWVGRVITIGGISWFVSNITARCSVIQRNPFTGEDTQGFIKEFGKWVLEQGFIDLAPEAFRRQEKAPNGLFCCVNTTLHGTLPSNPSLEKGMPVTVSDAT